MPRAFRVHCSSRTSWNSFSVSLFASQPGLKVSVFLSNIPWGKAFRRVPQIAGAHHERLNGTGYPNRLRAEEIPVQSKMMSISDIYDALTASDRPYKKAVPVDLAIEILEFGVKDGHLDVELVRIFREARIWERA